MARISVSVTLQLKRLKTFYHQAYATSTSLCTSKDVTPHAIPPHAQGTQSIYSIYSVVKVLILATVAWKVQLIYLITVTKMY